MNPLAFRRSLQEAWGYTAEVSEYRKSSHAVYRLRYHFVFITKYRKPALRGEIGKEVRDLTREICRSLDIEIVKGHVRPDHVHLLLDVPPRCGAEPSDAGDQRENVASSTARSPQVAQGVLGTTSLGTRVLRGDDWECERYDGCRVYRNPRCRDPRRRFSGH